MRYFTILPTQPRSSLFIVMKISSSFFHLILALGLTSMTFCAQLPFLPSSFQGQSSISLSSSLSLNPHSQIVETLTHPSLPAHSLRVIQPPGDICESTKGVRSWSGYLDVDVDQLRRHRNIHQVEEAGEEEHQLQDQGVIEHFYFWAFGKSSIRFRFEQQESRKEWFRWRVDQNREPRQTSVQSMPHFVRVDMLKCSIHSGLYSSSHMFWAHMLRWDEANWHLRSRLLLLFTLPSSLCFNPNPSLSLCIPTCFLCLLLLHSPPF